MIFIFTILLIQKYIQINYYYDKNHANCTVITQYVKNCTIINVLYDKYTMFAMGARQQPLTWWCVTFERAAANTWDSCARRQPLTWWCVKFGSGYSVASRVMGSGRPWNLWWQRSGHIFPTTTPHCDVSTRQTRSAMTHLSSENCPRNCPEICK